MFLSPHYGLPTLITHRSNNYDPDQFPEKLDPLVIFNAISGKKIAIHGDDLSIRDWLYAIDHCAAIHAVFSRGRPGETYNTGGMTEKTNLEVVKTICTLQDELRPQQIPYESLITYVEDRPVMTAGMRLIAASSGMSLGGFRKRLSKSGMRKTVLWYLNNREWLEQVTSGASKNWIVANYECRGARCGA